MKFRAALAAGMLPLALGACGGTGSHTVVSAPAQTSTSSTDSTSPSTMGMGTAGDTTTGPRSISPVTPQAENASPPPVGKDMSRLVKAGPQVGRGRPMGSVYASETKPTAGYLPPRALATTPIYCANAHIRESYSGYRIDQYTYYCWYVNGANVFSIGHGMLVGATNTAWTSLQIHWVSGVDTQYVQCYEAYGRSRGYCLQVTTGHFEQMHSGWRHDVWTMVKMYYNGYAECSDSEDRSWVRCSPGSGP